MGKKLYIDMHAIQTMPPSNVNRDDTGSPKTAQYGGAMRARVSSQSWKRAMRVYFNECCDAKNFGIRSLEIVKYIAGKIELIEKGISDEAAMELANATLNAAKVKTKDNKVKALFFISEKQAEMLAKVAVENRKMLESEKNKKREDSLKKYGKKVKEILQGSQSIDIALFGRMVAEDPSLNEDASAQVAHAISTHAVQTEFDFFTATDDLAAEDNAGAGMLGTIEFNSSTLYRYANIAEHLLLDQLKNKDDVLSCTKLFIESFCKSMPTGKINTFANQTLPQAVIITLRTDRPVNLVTAFETPVKSADGHVNKSIDLLKEEFKKAEKYVREPLATLTLGTEGLGEEQINLEELLNRVIESVASVLSDV